MNHHHLYIFWIFGKTGSFTKTAEELSIAQSAVTSQIKNLEEALGIDLIDRTNSRRPILASEGRKVLEYADSIFESSRELLNWATKGALPKEKILGIGAISGLSRNLQYEFMEPLLGKKDIKFEVTTGDQKNLIDLLSGHELDVVLTSHNVSQIKGGNLYANVLTASPVVFLIRRDSKIKKTGSISERLSGLDLFTPGQNFEAKPELDAYLGSLDSNFRIAGEVDDIALLRILALRSGSVVAMPEMGVKNDIESGDLKVIALAKDIQQRFYAITRQKLNPNNEINHLIEHIRRRRL